jgi:hypothetical protein
MADNRWKTDANLKSFLLTLKIPHNVPARRFVLKSEKKPQAIWSDFGDGPHFGEELYVSDHCNTKLSSQARLGSVYTNDTAVADRLVFTGSLYFQVEEIDVFEVRE